MRSSLIVRSIWAFCLLVATANHAFILLRHGLFWDYGGVGWASAVYWSGLTVVDPIVAALLFVRPRAGVAGTIALITTNVAHNLAVTARYAPEGEFLNRAAHPIILSQIGFMLFVGATARIAWRGTRSGARRRPASRSTWPRGMDNGTGRIVEAVGEVGRAPYASFASAFIAGSDASR
ncbi:hypothetical protein [Sphingomonas lenta]|uniref:hypothetical protein n=1 Tax=Sphingomonas lenta TaxID=1141887 RepID=UPI001595F7AC|nr:hypothetical protein [Sphingomonas lenta]